MRKTKSRRNSQENNKNVPFHDQPCVVERHCFIVHYCKRELYIEERQPIDECGLTSLDEIPKSHGMHLKSRKKLTVKARLLGAWNRSRSSE